MKKIILFFLGLSFFTACQDESGEIPANLKPISLKIEQGHTPVGVGQRVELKALSQEPLNNPKYTWNLYYQNEPIDELVADRSDIWLHARRGLGEYKVTVKVESGEKTGESDIFINVIDSDFEFGMFGNSKEVILKSEKVNDYDPLDVLIGMPEPFEGVNIENRLVFRRTTNNHIAYFFEEDKFRGGSKTQSGNSRNSNGRFVWYSLNYRNMQNNIEKKLGEGIENFNWSVDESRQQSYLNEPNFEGIGRAVDNGHLIVTTTWNKAGKKALIRLSRGYGGGSLLIMTITDK